MLCFFNPVDHVSEDDEYPFLNFPVSKNHVCTLPLSLLTHHFVLFNPVGHVSEDQLKTMYENSRPDTNSSIAGKLGLLDALNHAEVGDIIIPY